VNTRNKLPQVIVGAPFTTEVDVHEIKIVIGTKINETHRVLS